MAPPAGPADRHEPLPGLFGLPAHLLRQVSPRARRAILAGLALAFVGLIALAAVLGPRIADSNRERAERERAERQRAQAAELARRRAEQQPRRGVLSAGAPVPALVAGVERAITRDALARRETGELETPVRRTDCRALGRSGGRLALGCTAITTEIAPTEDSNGVLVGYPYRAAVSPASGRYALCKTSGSPGEGSFTRRNPVELPAACGG